MKRKSMRRVNVERREREWARAYGDDERVRWMKRQPCAVPGCRGWPSETAHVGNGGMSRKADADQTVPLCAAHHQQLDAGRGRRAFEQMHGLDLRAIAAACERRWRAERDGLDLSG